MIYDSNMFGLKIGSEASSFINQLPSNQSSSNQSGQVAVIVLLIVAVIATIGLSQLGRTTEDVLVSSQREESSRVFNAAEYGIEEALSDEDHFGNEANGSTYDLDDLDVDVTITPEENEMETTVPEGESLEIDLADLSGVRTLEVLWDRGSGDNCDLKASLMISVFQSSGTAYNYFVNPATNSCQKGEDFVDADFVDANVSGGYGSKFNFTVNGDSDKLIRITPLYASTDLKISGQGIVMAHTIQSVSQTTDAEEGGSAIQQKIEVQRLSPSSPSFMNFALFTNGKIEQIE